MKIIDCNFFYKLLEDNGVDFFTGVPDSLLKDICACIADNSTPGKHVVAPNEGNAVALASGYHLASGRVGLVYMQNSGLGNAINPLVSLNDPQVYSIPVILLIGWRGQPGIKDEPQHLKQGAITLELLNTLGIDYAILDGSEENATRAVKDALDISMTCRVPYALIVRKDVFKEYTVGTILKRAVSDLKREDALHVILDRLTFFEAIISTTGKLSREVFEYREFKKQTHECDFLNVGSMGHVSHIAMGIAMHKPDREVYCLDGDGSVLMHMGALASLGVSGLKNFKHILFNNGVHDSVGGQTTLGFDVDLAGVAEACGYKTVLRADNSKDLLKHVDLLRECTGPTFLEVKVKPGARSNLGRPTVSPQKNKCSFMDYLSK